MPKRVGRGKQITRRDDVASPRALGYGRPVSDAARPLGKPWITANQVTFARLAVLPFGCALLYSETGRWIALFLMTLVGCTDFVDGWLARKYGPTVLGGLMDPIADKLFVALTMLPALDLGWLPSSIVTLIFLREFVITAARTAYSRRDVTLKTSYISKVKTWYQMIIIAFLFLLEEVKWKESVVVILGVGAVGAVVGGLVFYVVKRRVWRGSVAFAISFGGIFAVSLLVERHTFSLVLGWLTVAITWASGGGYLAGIKDLPGTARFDAHDAVRLFGAIAMPLIACPLIGLNYAAAWPVFSTVALEFAVGGLDNLLAHNKTLGSWRWWGVRVGLQAGFLGAALAVALQKGPPGTVFALTLGALAVTAVATVIEFTRHKQAYLDADRTARAA